jgi:5-methyltetrahydropteroyltriglutamate--homocysteine methyltransferase
MVQSSVLGFPRMGGNRELKKANEAYWADKLSRDDLLKEAKRLRLEHWKIQKDAGVDIIPSNDFAFYDHILDHIQLFNVRAQLPIALDVLLTTTGNPRALFQAWPEHSR